MAILGAVTVVVSLLCIGAASDNEASSISKESAYRKVRYRVRDVVAMLQIMQEHVLQDGQDETELFGKYMYYCRRGRAAMEASIEEAENTDLDGLKDTIAGDEETREEIMDRLTKIQAEQAHAEKAMVKAKALRDYDAVEFQQESSKIRQNIATLKKAIAALDEDTDLDQPVVFLLKELSGSMGIKQADRDSLKAFLKKVKSVSLAPHQQEVHSVLSHTIEALQQRLAKLTAEETSAKQVFQDYKDMIQERTDRLNKVIRKKESDIADLNAEVGLEKESLEDATNYLLEGQAFLPFISDSENCTEREDEWAERCRTRTSELAAIAESIRVLTDENQINELWRTSLPKPWKEVPHPAIVDAKLVSESGKSHSAFDLRSLASKGKNASVAKIFKVIDGMVALLHVEQANATNQHKYCGQSLNQTEEDLKKLTVTVSQLATTIAQHEKRIASLNTEIQEVHDGIHELDRQIVNGAKVRKQEHEDNSEILTTDNVTLNLLQSAAAALKAFYSDELTSTSGARLEDVIGQYQKKHQESSTILEMLDSMLKEMAADMAKVQAIENSEQNEWDLLVKQSLDKYDVDMRSISDKQRAKTELEANLISIGKEKTEKMQEAKDATKTLSELKGNNTGFLRPSVCARKLPMLQGMEPGLPKNIILW